MRFSPWRGAAARGGENPQRVLLQDAEMGAGFGSWQLPAGAQRAVWSPGLCRIAGQPEGFSPSLEQFLALVHPDDRARLQADIEVALGGEDATGEYRLIRPGGEVRHVRARRHARLEEGRGTAHLFGSVQDLTDERLREVELRRERDLARLVLSCMSDGFLLTREGRIIQVNDAFCRIVGFPRHDLVGAAPPYPFWPPEAVDLDALLGRVQEGELREFPATLMHRDGARVSVGVTCVPARGHDGELLGYISTVHDVSEQRRLEAEIERLASEDQLTGLLSHRVFHERLQAETARARRHGRSLSLALLDLDGFRAINERHGHLTGDRILREVARRLRTLVRDGEHLARVGGEQFGWILPDAEGIGAIAAAERARSAIGRRPFAGVGFVTLSVGVCELGEAGDSQQLYRHADQALLWAKQLGRDRSFRYSSATAAELLGGLPPEQI